MSRKTRPVRALAPMALALLLASCGDSADSSLAAASNAGMPPASALPDCASIAAATNGFVDGWLLAKDSGPVHMDKTGAFLVFPSGRLDFDKPLTAIGPSVNIGKVSVSVVQTGTMLINEIDEGKPMTNRRAVDTALAVHRLIRR